MDIVGRKIYHVTTPVCPVYVKGDTGMLVADKQRPLPPQQGHL